MIRSSSPPRPELKPFRSRIRHAGLRLGQGLRAWVLLVMVAGWLNGMMHSQAQAERADRFQPIQVESDRMQYDDIKQVNVFTGQVVLTRGTLVLRSDQLVLRQDPEGYAHGTATGQLARFRQKRDGLNEWIEGQGEELIYDGKAETLRILRKAQVRRLDGSRLLDEIEGASILYDSRSEHYTVEGAGARAPAGSGRVRVTIQPRVSPETAPKASQ
ncbi:MAG: lipopolysaccharide transport periplasmic protein LptA [Burkholderiaceae bacterium]